MHYIFTLVFQLNCIVGLSFLGLHFQNEKQIETLKMENPEVQTGINVLNRKFYNFVRQHKTRTQHLRNYILSHKSFTNCCNGSMSDRAYNQLGPAQASIYPQVSGKLEGSKMLPAL